MRRDEALARFSTPESQADGREEVEHLLFVPSATGYALLPVEGPTPSVGTVVEWGDHGPFTVTKVAASPLAGDGRRCA